MAASETDAGADMRAGKIVEVLELARALAASGEGLSMEAMCEISHSGRRTVERRLAAIEEVFGAIDRVEGDGRTLLYRLPGGTGDRLLTRVTALELAELEHAIAAADTSDTDERAGLLRSLLGKLRASLRAVERTRLDTDLEALMESETLACRPGPRTPVPADVLETLRRALLMGRMVGFHYGDHRDPFDLVPWGVLFGQRSYLIASFAGATDPFTYRLDRMRDVAVLERAETRPAGFDLAAFAAKSFSTFHEEPQQVVLRFSPAAADDARAFSFHSTQVMSDNEDGSLTVTFTAGGFRQMAHHLFTWGPTVTIIEPPALREEMRACLSASFAALDGNGAPPL